MRHAICVLSLCLGVGIVAAQPVDKLDTPEAAVDKEMGEAIEIARCGDLDGWVNCTVQVNHEFAGLVREIAGECEKQHAA